MITDQKPDPAEGWKLVIGFPKCAFQVAMGRERSWLYKREVPLTAIPSLESYTPTIPTRASDAIPPLQSSISAS